VPPVTHTQNFDLDSWFSLTGGNWGSGKSNYMYLGETFGSWQNRIGVRIPRGSLFTGVPSADAMSAFNLKMRVKNGCDGIGGTIRIMAERGTTALGENSETNDCEISENGTVGVSRWPGPDTDTANRGSYSGSPGGDAWIAVNCLDLGKWWFANPSVTALVVVLFAGNLTNTAHDESTAGRRIAFYSRHSASVPYAELTYNDNVAPNAPSDLDPPADAKLASTAGTSATVTSRHTDTEGDSASRFQAQWFPDATTDATADATTPTKDYTSPATGQPGAVNTPHNTLRSYTFTGLPARTAGKWRMRFYDGQWGAWSPLQRGITAYKPTAVNLSVQPGTLTPLLYASIASSDPADYITAVDEVVYQDPAAGETITKWAPGKQSIGGAPTRSEVTYGGSALGFGAPPGPYRRRVIIYNRDDVPSDQTANTYFTQLEAVGPNVTPGDTLTKQNTRTPTVALTDPGAANIDRARVEWLNEAGTTVLYDTGVESFTSAASRNMTAPAGIYDWGQLPRGRAYIRVTGNANLGPAREFQLRINALPGAPYPVSVAGGQTIHHGPESEIAVALGLTDGVYVTTDSTPDVTFPFVDLDKVLGYTEAMTRQEVEVRDLADAHTAGSPFVDATAPIAELFTLATIPAETTRKARARVDDNAATRSAFSDYVFVKFSAAPTLSSVTPANGATVTDPTPTFGWVYASSGGKAQAAYRLVAKQGQTTLVDTGLVAGDDDGVTLDPFVLPNGATIVWDLTVYDADGLSVVVSRSFTTSFTQPPALTGLTITPDDEEKALLLTWSESALPINEFYAYIVEARSGDGDFQLVTTITTKSTHAFLYRGAAHNRETIIRITQSNGFASSEPLEGSGMLIADGYWVRTSSRIDELVHVTGHGPGDTNTRIERMEPLQRPEAVLLDWGTTGYEGTFAITTDDREAIERLRRYKELAEVVMFKFPYGAVRYARIIDTPDADGVAAWANASVTYVSVTPESANF
jgi:hypothetical protein